MSNKRVIVYGTASEQALVRTIEELRRENAALRAWKESALAVERELNAQTTAKLLGVRLGESCHKVIAEKVPQLVAENAKLREVLNRLGYDETGRVLFQGVKKEIQS